MPCCAGAARRRRASPRACDQGCTNAHCACMMPTTSAACTVSFFTADRAGHGSEYAVPPVPPKLAVWPSTAVKIGAPQVAPTASRSSPDRPYTPTTAWPCGHSAENSDPWLGSGLPIASVLKRAPKLPSVFRFAHTRPSWVTRKLARPNRPTATLLLGHSTVGSADPWGSSVRVAPVRVTSSDVSPVAGSSLGPAASGDDPCSPTQPIGAAATIHDDK